MMKERNHAIEKLIRLNPATIPHTYTNHKFLSLKFVVVVIINDEMTYIFKMVSSTKSARVILRRVTGVLTSIVCLRILTLVIIVTWVTILFPAYFYGRGDGGQTVLAIKVGYSNIYSSLCSILRLECEQNIQYIRHDTYNIKPI